LLKRKSSYLILLCRWKNCMNSEAVLNLCKNNSE
jgi:hypothetical protein